MTPLNIRQLKTYNKIPPLLLLKNCSVHLLCHIDLSIFLTFEFTFCHNGQRQQGEALNTGP